MSDELLGIKKPIKIFDSWSLSIEKSQNELAVVERLLQDLNIEYRDLIGTASQDPPDCVVVIDGKALGIEVLNLIDFNARKLSAKARKFDSAEFYAQWTKDSFQKHIEELVFEKHQKIKTGFANRSAATSCEKFWLVISTDEMTLYSAVVSEFVADWKLSSDVFDCVYLILSYEPGREDSGYVHFRLN
jgi:hypothetical protein